MKRKKKKATFESVPARGWLLAVRSCVCAAACCTCGCWVCVVRVVAGSVRMCCAVRFESVCMRLWLAVCCVVVRMCVVCAVNGSGGLDACDFWFRFFFFPVVLLFVSFIVVIVLIRVCWGKQESWLGLGWRAVVADFAPDKKSHVSCCGCGLFSDFLNN